MHIPWETPPGAITIAELNANLIPSLPCRAQEIRRPLTAVSFINHHHHVEESLSSLA
ncbi:hypothetical protein L484_005599 [Morus notabilis]|uniref:Uncharacterized protein n=1 Tax=Morus notabilis TaxID=981085 RepID=W9RH89_9ROSA|nr:hypothetical protein L484_005599 [Morus notabilis]